MEAKRAYFKKGTTYHKKPQSKGARYCRCLLHVGEKQPTWCLHDKAWRQKRNGKTCYNPYAVCTKTLKRKGVMNCKEAYNTRQFTKAERDVYRLMRNPKPAALRKRPTRATVKRAKVTVKDLRARAKARRPKQPVKFKGYYRWRKIKLCRELNVKCAA